MEGDFNVSVPGFDISSQSADLSIQSGLHVSNRPLCLFHLVSILLVNFGKKVLQPGQSQSGPVASEMVRDPLARYRKSFQFSRQSAAVLPAHTLNDLCKEQQLKVPSHS
jgi:hypothetical protein